MKVAIIYPSHQSQPLWKLPYSAEDFIKIMFVLQLIECLLYASDTTLTPRAQWGSTIVNWSCRPLSRIKYILLWFFHAGILLSYSYFLVRLCVTSKSCLLSHMDSRVLTCSHVYKEIMANFNGYFGVNFSLDSYCMIMYFIMVRHENFLVLDR